MYLRGEGSLAGCRRLLWAGDRHDREGKRRLPRCDEGRDLATEKIKTAKKKECGATILIFWKLLPPSFIQRRIGLGKGL